MTRISTIRVKQTQEKQLLIVRRTIDFFAEYAELMTEALKRIDAVLEENHLLPASGPVVCFHNVELEVLDVEIGLEVAVSVHSKDSAVQCVKVPSRVIALTIDRGPYEEQDPTLEDLLAWIEEQGYTAQGGIYYHYLNDEEQLPKDYLTEMFIPVKKK
ncbi:GyrI-like domain-containing protein [Enterococcus sp. BWM-S5]|uniref:GyrI-like domain-containing protein n=1 Tax=Enterococcus larvae TaxID=2794352 RepID=A0ABS4CH45_9ENTE|nr:GyrI-like domain-containing protein [Enterococcus larvae]MBP1045944.1 GyrI-like domain-containing protein [Enterococcus larvae]